MTKIRERTSKYRSQKDSTQTVGILLLLAGLLSILATKRKNIINSFHTPSSEYLMGCFYKKDDT